MDQQRKSMGRLAVNDEYQRRGIDVVFIENDHLRIEVLVGKGGDIAQIRHKRTDINVLFECPHNWRPPQTGQASEPTAQFRFEDHYPGGWQTVLPNGGGPSNAHGASLALHGESAVIPWEGTTFESAAAVGIRMSTDLTRYPFHCEREVRLEEDDSTVYVRESVTNNGEIPVQFSWVQHVALGRPLVSPSAELDIPCEQINVDPNHDHDNTRLTPGVTVEWPGNDVDFQSFPEKSQRVFDLASFAELSEGRYTVSNPNIDLATTVSFDESLYEYVWYWGAFGGHTGSPFFGRNYNVGLEPATSIPISGGLDAAIENGTANELDPGDTVETSISLQTHHSVE